MKRLSRPFAWLLAGTLSACGVLPEQAPPPRLHALNAELTGTTVVGPRPATATLIVSPTRATAGLDSQRMLYQRTANEVEYFAYNRWVDTPARMLPPLIAGALARQGRFAAVVTAPTSVVGDYQLDTEIVRLQQEFMTQPSRVRLVLRAVLSETAGGRVLAAREFEALVPAPSDSPPGGAAAANAALTEVLRRLAEFCQEATVGNR